MVTTESPARWIGPIPEGAPTPATHRDTFPGSHPGGPTPAWGGYCPVPATDGLRPVVKCVDDDNECCPVTHWVAHTTPTRLLRVPESYTDYYVWYVAAPDRDTRRGVQIAVEAMRAGYLLDPPATGLCLHLNRPYGLRPTEIEAAREIVAGIRNIGDALPWETREAPGSLDW